MSSSGQRGGCRGTWGERGFSLVEMMAALAVASVVGVGLYAIYNSTTKSSISQRMRNDLQTNCTFAMDQMKTEMALAGYRATNPAQPISAATAETVTFEYWDDNASALTGHDNHTRITYAKAASNDATYRIATGDLVREVRRYNTATDTFDLVTKQTLVNNAQTLSFSYFQGDNAVWAGSLGQIRTIKTTLTCESSRFDPNNPLTPTRPRITLVSEVRARNVGVSATPTDVTPPATPTGATAWDPGLCGTLQIRWDANTEADLEGYILYAGLTTGAYSKRYRIPAIPKPPNQYEYYTLTGLTSTKTTDAVPAQYHIALQAYDKSGNMSVGFSPEATSLSPTTQTTAEPAKPTNPAETDTIINPVVPTPPGSFAAVATPGVDGSVSLSWTPPATPGLLGYRIYRDTSAANFAIDNRPPVWVGGVNSGGNLIADQNLVGATDLSFTDTGALTAPGGKLVGCQTYYYKIAAVICDPSLVAGYTDAQFAAASAVPDDNVAPSSPLIGARPGWKRIILTLSNPVLDGPGADPDWIYTKIFWSKGGFPSIGTARWEVSPSPTIPRDAGTFTDDHGGYYGTMNFNHETSATATTPSLDDDTTYYFLAVAYDKCGNHTGVTDSSVAEGTQCGDCLLPSPPNPPGSHDPACYGAPPEVTGLDKDGCFGYVDLRWDAINDTVVRDFQGYRILRREGPSWVGGTNEVDLTNDTAAWLPYFRDTSVEEGKTYSYYIMATDCYYEQHHGKPEADWPESGNDPDDNFSEGWIMDTAIGRPFIDPTRPQVVTGFLGLDPPPFRHNPATFWVTNGSDARLSLLTLAAKWENPAAYLERIVVGPGTTTLATDAFTDTATPLTHGSAGSTIAFNAGTRLEANDHTIPFVSVFRNADRSVTRATDMRANWIDYALTFRNESTGTEGCAVSGSVFAPLGPYVYAMSQDRPYFGTLSWPVPGEEGSNFLNAVTVPGGADVTVYAEVLDGSGAGIPSGYVQLYYSVDPTKALASAPAVTGTFPALNYSAVTMTKVAGDQWRGTIPMVADANVWYFVVAVDAQGNFDRDPEPWAGAYQYYQQPPDNCATIPNPPVIAGSSSGGNVTLTWAVPTTNSTPTGTPYTDQGGYKVYRNRNDGTGWQLHYGGPITNPATTTWTDGAVYNLDSFMYQYYVTSYDTCTPTPNESPASNIYTELVESDCGNTPSPPVISGLAAALPDRVTLTWAAPTTNAPPSTAPLTDLGGYEVWRQTNGGPWLKLAELSASATTFLDSTASNIKNVMYAYYLTAFDSCSPTRKTSASSNIYTEPLVNNPCDEIPNPPALAGSATSSAVTLTWTPPTHNTNGEIFQDPGGYRIWRSRDGGPFTQEAEVGPATYGWTDGTVAADIGSATYAYQVTVIDNCGTPNESAASSTYTESYVGPCGTLPAPPTLAGTTGAAGVILTWSTNPNVYPAGMAYDDVGGFRLFRRKNPSTAWVQLGGDLGPGSLTITDVPPADFDDPGVVYEYAVATFDQCTPTANVSGVSNIYAEGYTDPCTLLTAPAPPGNLTLYYQNNNATASGLSWGAAAPAPDGYRVYACSQTDTGSTPTQTCTLTKISSPDPLTVTSYTHSLGGTKIKDIEWFYGVKAVNKGSCADPSRWVESSGYNLNGILADPHR